MDPASDFGSMSFPISLNVPVPSFVSIFLANPSVLGKPLFNRLAYLLCADVQSNDSNDHLPTATRGNLQWPGLVTCFPIPKACREFTDLSLISHHCPSGSDTLGHSISQNFEVELALAAPCDTAKRGKGIFSSHLWQ